MSTRKVRLDALVFDRGLAETREKARALILAGEVLVGDQPGSKPGQMVPADADVSVRQPLPFVSRGGLKLERALDAFGLEVTGLTLLDVGASTGGFTDCLLKRGARRVYAVDVGYGQLDWRLRRDPRVVVMERTNVRYLTSLPEVPDSAVADVSFISLALVLPPVARLLKPTGWIVALVKPQFEAGKEQVGRGGVVRDTAVHRAVLEKVCACAEGIGLRIRGCVPSPMVGPAGNVEFFVHLSREAGTQPAAELIEGCLVASPLRRSEVQGEGQGGGIKRLRGMSA